MRLRVLLLASCGLAVAAPTLAQTVAAAATPADDGEIVVTAVARGTNKLDTSISVSSLSGDAIAQIAPRSVAEVFRNLPGIRSESSGGEGNANIAVRGLPVASGGAKFLQLQEDGLPVLEFGDITFGNADIFLRSDFNVARIESVRGGSASTFASNSPGGVINLISKHGETEGGAVQASFGLDYKEYRLDADYGGKLGAGWAYHVGGFYRQGTGPRAAGYDGNKGGQIKANLTREFERGYVRVYAKYLDDKAIGYLPNPVRVTGSNGDPKYSNVPGFDINNDTLHSRYFTRALTLGPDNKPVTDDIRDGQHPRVFAGGLEAQFDLGSGWSVTDRFRYASISGRFISPFPASVADAQTTANGIGGAGSTLRYANGPNGGQAITSPGTLNGNGLLASIVLFDTKLNNLDNITNDLRLAKDFKLGTVDLSLTGGFYGSRQNINTSWLWTSYLLEVKGGGNAALVDVFNAAGQRQTDAGQVAYGASFFGNCCRRTYDVHYNTYAPFASLTAKAGALTVDGSLRYDFGEARGRVFGADLGGGRVGVVPFDVNGDGAISRAEQQTSVIPLGSPAPVNYNYHYLSYSVGANYRVVDDLALFGRYSRGARANADRLLFGPAVSAVTGRLTDSSAAVDFVEQAEIGGKYRAGGLSLYLTGFYAKTAEQNFEATTQRFFNRKYDAYGLEAETAYRMGNFSIAASGTYTKAKIKSDVLNPAVVGNRPRRQAEFIYQVTPQFATERFTVGASVVGTTSSFTQDSNQLKLPAYTTVNAFLSVRPVPHIEASINANNLFNTDGFTEAEDGSIPANGPATGIVRARSISGRSVSASVRYSF